MQNRRVSPLSAARWRTPDINSDTVTFSQHRLCNHNTQCVTLISVAYCHLLSHIAISTNFSSHLAAPLLVTVLCTVVHSADNHHSNGNINASFLPRHFIKNAELYYHHNCLSSHRNSSSFSCHIYSIWPLLSLSVQPFNVQSMHYILTAFILYLRNSSLSPH